jgi:prevent-host-death family protein
MIVDMGTTYRAATAGVREAKARLSQILDDVQRGKEWIITEHGRPVARLVPIGKDALGLRERLKRLEAIGILEPAARRSTPIPPPLPMPKGLAQRLLDEDRGK